jgi:hypothetical protein
VITGGGTWFALQPSSPSHSSDHPTEASGAEETTKAQPLHDMVKEKKEQVKTSLVKASLIKPERHGNSEQNHATASENNEHKVRQGKFCDDEFDNHVTVHSNDPSKDFEKMKKAEAAQGK